MKKIRPRLSYANVMSSLAVFLVLGGGAAFAATQLPKNSVGTKQLKKNAVSTAKVRKNAVTTPKIKANAVTTAKIAENAVTGVQVADGSLGTADLADGAVNSAKVLDRSLTGDDVAEDTLTGTNIKESTLGQVPDAAKLQGKAATAFTSSSIYKNESAVEAGTELSDGTFVIAEACNPGDVLLSGGPANISSESTLLESFPTPGVTNSWTARINKNGKADNFSVVVLCAKQE